MRELASRMPAQKAADSPTGPGADDRDVADVVEVGMRHGASGSRAVAGTGSPSTALSARSTEVAMQVKLGVSRRV